jgi:hypothetical protein
LLSLQTANAKEPVWRYMKVDNVEIIADVSEKELIELHDEIFYFNRTIETFLPQTKKPEKETIKALIVPTRRSLQEIIGKQSQTLSGIYGGLPSIQIIALRSSTADAKKTLLWGLTMHKLKPLNQRRWFTNAFALLFNSTEVERKSVKIGSIEEEMKNFIRFSQNLSDASLNNMFVNDSSWNNALGDSHKMLFYKAHSYYFTHYCLLGNQALLKPFLDFSKESAPNETQFIKHFGFDFEELEKRLWEYATKGRHKAFVIDSSNLAKPPPPTVRLATEREWKNALIRAKFIKKDKTEARALLYEMPEDDPTAIETRGILAYIDTNKDEVLAMARRAQELGVENPILQVNLAGDTFFQLMRERRKEDNPKLSKAEAEAFINQIRLGLKYYRRYIRSVRTLIQILDASQAKVPISIEPLFKAWEEKEAMRYPNLKLALDEIRDRSGIIKTN